MSEVNPYIPPTCPSQRFCKNHKYNTGGLFSGFYNENGAIHCGQEHIELPKFEKMLGGSALPGNTNINVAPGEQLVANNGIEFTDMFTDSNMAAMRTGFVEVPDTPSPALVAAKDLNNRREGFANTAYPDYTTKVNGINAGSIMSSAPASSKLIDHVCGTNKKKDKSAIEKFCGACASPCGCAVMGVIAAIVVAILLVLWFNSSARCETGRNLFGGRKHYQKPGNDDGNMNVETIKEVDLEVI